MANWKCSKCGFEKEARCKPKKCSKCGAANSFAKLFILKPTSKS